MIINASSEERVAAVGVIPWEKINNFILDCGNVRDPKDFCIGVLHKINSVTPYDKGRIFFLNKAGKVYNVYLLGVGKKESEECLEYYYKIADEKSPLKNWIKSIIQ